MTCPRFYDEFFDPPVYEEEVEVEGEMDFEDED